MENIQDLWKLPDIEKNAATTALIDPSPQVIEALQRDGFRSEIAMKSQKDIFTPIEVVYLARE